VLAQRDADFAAYVEGRLPSLRRLALLLCQDSQRGDDVVQAAIIRLYMHWPKASAARSTDAYVNAILVREFLHERRSGWMRRVSLTGDLPDAPAAPVDHDGAMDLEAAVAALPPRQRAILVLRFYCDLSVDQCAEHLGCTSGTVKSQTAKALRSLRRELGGRPDDEQRAPAATSQARRPDHA
jgi:RNA polymerase sigma-70 factor (sigma-E family)